MRKIAVLGFIALAISVVSCKDDLNVLAEYEEIHVV